MRSRYLEYDLLSPLFILMWLHENIGIEVSSGEGTEFSVSGYERFLPNTAVTMLKKKWVLRIKQVSSWKPPNCLCFGGGHCCAGTSAFPGASHGLWMCGQSTADPAFCVLKTQSSIDVCSIFTCSHDQWSTNRLIH